MNRLASSAAGRSSDVLDHDLTAAWLALLLVPLGSVASLLSIAASRALLGYGGSPVADLPLQAGVPVVATAGGVFLVPCAVAWVRGRRAVVAGDPGGWAPAILGATSALAYLGLSLAAIAVTRSFP